MGNVLGWCIQDPNGGKKENSQDNLTDIGIIFVFLDNALIQGML